MSGYLSSSFAGVVFWKRIRQQRSQQARLREYVRLITNALSVLFYSPALLLNT